MKYSLFPALALAACLGCANVRTSAGRLAKDVCVVLASPAQIPCGAVRDGLAYSSDHSVDVSFSPVVVPLMAVKHLYFTAIYALDILWSPAYLPLGLPPIELYEVDRFPWKTHAEGHQWIYEELLGSTP